MFSSFAKEGRKTAAAAAVKTPLTDISSFRGSQLGFVSHLLMQVWVCTAMSVHKLSSFNIQVFQLVKNEEQWVQLKVKL